MTASQQRALDELWPSYGVEFEAGCIDFTALFGRAAPIVLEIGFGNGDTLVEQAQRTPGHDFLGIEVHEPGVGHCLIAANKAGVGNLKLMVHDAVEVLEQRIADAGLARINLYFPDPWPKKRHHKRRIVQKKFIATCGAKMVPGGSLYIATDWANYAEHIDEVLESAADFVLVERREHDGDRPLDRPMTKFERRGLREGHRITDWRFDKIHL